MPGYVDSKKLADKFVQGQKDRHDNPDKFRGYRFPMPWFMQHTGGWGPGWLCWIYGKAGKGKSSVLATAATQMGRDGVKFLYFSLEENLYTVAQRIFSNLEDINRTKFRDVKLTSQDWPNVYAAAQQMQGFSGYWAAGLYNEKEITDTVVAVDPDVILLDYYQLMEGIGQTQNEKMSNAAGVLLKLARGKYTKGKKITTIVAAQLNDNNEVLHSRDPDRHGDLILEIADIDNGNGGALTDKKRFTIRKFRYGSVDSTTIAFFGARSLVGEFQNSPNQGPIPKP